MYVRKEAVLSSQIEGTQSSLSDLLLFEADSIPAVAAPDVREVSNYVNAQEHGIERLHGGFPLSLRLLREVHQILLRRTRGSQKDPGEFRRTQNWIGGSRPGNAMYVPPPVHEMMTALDQLEKFLHDDPVRIAPIIKAGLAHAQFESIHPFLDGNGRLGRLLITFVLLSEKVLSRPLLYPSLYFKRHRAEYYEALQRVRTEGDWEGWIDFYLQGMRETAEEAAATIGRIVKLMDDDRRKILGLRTASASTARVYEHLQKRAIIDIPVTAKRVKLTKPTVAAALERLMKLGIAREITGRARDRLFSYVKYVAILSEGTTPDPRPEF
jgi:Fic family protein